MATNERTYRFGPLDRGGWVLGLGGSQCVAIALGIVLGGLFLNAGMLAPVALAPVGAGVAYAFATVHRQPVHEFAPAAARFTAAKALRRTRWTAELPLLSCAPVDERRRASLPPF